MTASIFDGCSESCGWIAAAVAALAYGSYGVPIKSCGNVDVDPLVMQSYKTFVFFATCWFVLLLGEEVRFTAWGIASGLFWVPGATCGIPAIRYAGMAVAVGTWASIIVLMNFFWGLFVFQESVKSFAGASGAFLLLTIGLIGMSKYSDAPSTEVQIQYEEATELVSTSMHLKRELRKRASDVEEASTVDSGFNSDSEDSYTAEKNPASKAKDRVIILGTSMTLRQVGIICAAINGVWGGSCLIPMHYANLEGYSGAGFLISFATGSLIVNVALWVALFLYRLQRSRGSVRDAIAGLPSWHVDKLLLPGIMSGILFSIGMFGSILAVTFLGQGVGNSFVEIQILVSGLWGIFYYNEISGREVVTKWFASACISIFGILWLSYEHVSDRAHRHH